MKIVYIGFMQVELLRRNIVVFCVLQNIFPVKHNIYSNIIVEKLWNDRGSVKYNIL